MACNNLFNEADAVVCRGNANIAIHFSRELRPGTIMKFVTVDRFY